MNKAIMCCKCGQTPKYSEDSYKILFPKEKVPDIYAGDVKISDLLQKLKPSTNIYIYVRSLIRTKDKFSYYMAWNNDGTIVEQWDLLKGRRVG